MMALFALMSQQNKSSINKLTTCTFVVCICAVQTDRQPVKLIGNYVFSVCCVFVSFCHE